MSDRDAYEANVRHVRHITHEEPGLATTVHVAEVNGRVEVVGVDVRTFIDDGGGVCSPMGDRWQPVTSDVLRGLSLPYLRRSALEYGQMTEDSAGAVSLGVELTDDVLRSARAQLRSGLDVARDNPTAVTYDRDYYLEVAQVYAAAWADGEDPTRAVRDRWGLSQRTAARHVSTARNAYGFLYKTTKLKPDGRLTAKARRLLEQRKTEG